MKAQFIVGHATVCLIVHDAYKEIAKINNNWKMPSNNKPEEKGENSK